LVPRRALELTSEFYLQLENFSSAQVLENRIEASIGAGAPAASISDAAQPLLEAIAQPTATPGGGSVAALAGALGSALGEMVAGISLKKKSFAVCHPQMAEAIKEFRRSAQALTKAADDDAKSYDAVLAAHKLPKETPEEARRREAAIQQALKGAAEMPLQVARHAAQVFEKLGQLQSMSSPSMLSDVQVGRLMAGAAVQGALKNVSVNLDFITDAEFASRLRSESTEIQSRLSEDPVGVARQ